VLHRKTGVGDAILGGRLIGGRSFKKSSFGRVTRQEGILGHNPDRPFRHAFFDEALCLDIGIPGVFGVAVDRVSVCLTLKIASGAFMGRPFDGLTADIMSPCGESFGRRSCTYRP